MPVCVRLVLEPGALNIIVRLAEKESALWAQRLDSSPKYSVTSVWFEYASMERAQSQGENLQV